MNKMKLFRFGIACLSILSMTACGNQTDTSSSTATSGDAEGIQFTITLNVSNPEAGSVSGAGTYTYSKSNPRTVSSKSNDGWKFAGWYLPDGTLYSNYISFRYTESTDLTLEARWKPAVYTLTVKSKVANAGVLEGAGNYSWKDAVTLKATANEGYDFIAWTDVKGNLLSNEATYSFEMPAEDKVIYAEFSETAENYGDGTYTRTLSYITMGNYPQTEITDRATTGELHTALGDSLPTASTTTAEDGTVTTTVELNGWTDYGYYYQGAVDSYMYYQDFDYGSDKYRAVYFTKYRPFRNDYPNEENTEEESSLQFEYRYRKNVIYYFKWEPINWTILEENKTADEHTAYLISAVALDAQNFYHDISESATRTIHGNPVNPNNYAYSEIRSWLNDDFYNVAFTEAQQNIIQCAQVDNTCDSTNSLGDANDNICNDTMDSVTLLSYLEAKYTYFPSTTERLCAPTDYAKIQGAYYDSLYKSTYWMLRSPSMNNTTNVSGVKYDGKLGGYFAHKSQNAIRPAIRVNL